MPYLPRHIDPSLVTIGDTIMVTYHKQNGVELSLRGTIYSVEDDGNWRYFYTREHGNVLTYEIGKPKAISVLLIKREEIRQETLAFFSSDNEELVQRFMD